MTTVTLRQWGERVRVWRTTHTGHPLAMLPCANCKSSRVRVYSYGTDQRWFCNKQCAERSSNL